MYDLQQQKEDKENSKLQRTNQDTKDSEELSTKGRIFPHNAKNGFLLFLSL